jgi:EmrB/QacA subfamily drug resistance transporter
MSVPLEQRPSLPSNYLTELMKKSMSLLTSGRPTTKRSFGPLLALLAFAQLVIGLDYNIVFVALPIIGEQLGFNPDSLQWVVSAYAVAFGGFLLLGGRAADLFGRRRMFIVGLALYAGGSLLGGLAQEPPVLVIARAIQGLGGAVLAPATLSLVSTSFAEGKSRNTAFSIWAAAGSSGMVLGSLLGGILTGSLGWESVFFVNVPLAGLGIVASLMLIPKDKPRTSATAKLDVPGALTSTVGALAIVFALVQVPEFGWTSPQVLIAGFGGAAIFALFIQLQKHAASPLVPLRLFRNRNLSLGTLLTFVFMGTFGALPYFLTIHFQQVIGMTPLSTGFAFILPSVCVLAGTVLGGRMRSGLGSRQTLLGAFAVGIGATVALGLAVAQTQPFLVISIPLAVLSLAQGVVFTVMFAVATTGTADSEQGVASGIATAGQQVGGAVGLAGLIIGTAAIAGLESTLQEQMSIAIYSMAGGLLLGVIVALFLERSSANHEA